MSANNASKLTDLRPGGGLRPGGSVQRKKSDDNVCQNKLQLVGGREIMDSRTKITDNKKNGGTGDRVEGNRRNKGRNTKTPRPKPELKVNSRASSWANSEVAIGDKSKSSNKPQNQRCQRVSINGSKSRARDSWAAARADMEKKGKSIDKRGTDIVSSANKEITYNPTSLNSIGPDCGPSYSSQRRIRNEWEKIDNDHAKSEMEDEMEVLLALMNDAEVGMIHTISAKLPIELPDGNGGHINATQEQMLTDATANMMGRWVTHKKWTIDEARLAGQILLRMEREEIFYNEALPQQDVAINSKVLLQKEDYLAVINAFAKVTLDDETASIRADNLLDHMEKRAKEGRLDLKPDRLMINTGIGAQAKHALSGHLSLESISAAERMLDTLEREYESGDNTMQPTSRTYSKFIDLYAKHGRAEDASRALERMEIQFRKGNKAALPTTIHYTSVIDALANKADASGRAARNAEEVLRSMLDLYDKGEYNLAPDSIIFSVAINAYAKCKRPDAAERSLGILALMDKYNVDPDIITYNTVLNTLSQNPNYRTKAKSILQYVEGNQNLRADSFTYNAVIKGCLPEEAEELIQQWESEYTNGHTDERPDSYTYTALIKSWTLTNTIGYEDKCAKILRWMEENEVVGMNRVVYNEVMKAFSRSTRNDAGDLAQGVFDKLVQRYNRSRDREFRPDRFSFMALLNAYCRSCTSREYALKAERVLFDMMNSNFLPDPKLCNNVVSAWARSNAHDAAAHAERICERMDSLEIEIDGVVFNSLVNVYAQRRDSDRAFHVLDRMIERNVEPTSVTYTFLVEACGGDQERVMKVFESCIKHGMLDERLRKSFMNHGPQCLREQLSASSIPYVWGENANRGPGGLSRGKIKSQRKRGGTGADIGRVGWAR